MFEDVLRFWLDRGVDGFRVDVAHGLFKEASRCATRSSPRARCPVRPAAPEHEMVEREVRDEPMWDQPEVHDVYRAWHKILDEAGPDRMAVAEAWTQTPESMAAFVRPDELDQTFNFAWLLADWSAEAFAEVITDTLAAVEPVGASPTWVLSNHDVVRHVTRYGGGAQGLARARAATLTMLALPGSSYLYQGEELGLEQVDVAPEDRQDPSYLRTGEVGRDGCRVPIPWGGTEAPYDFGPGSTQPWIPQPADWAPLTVEAQAGDPDSTLAFYRDALRVRRDFAWSAGESRGDARPRRGRARVPSRPADRRAQLRRRPRRAARGRAAARQRPGRRASCRPTRPPGSADARIVRITWLVRTGGRQLLDADYPGRCAVSRRRGRRCTPPAGRRTPDSSASLQSDEPLVEAVAAAAAHLLEALAALVGRVEQDRPAVLGVGLALDEAEVDQRLHLPADPALVHAEGVGEVGAPHRAVGGQVGEDEVRHRVQVGVDLPGALAHHPLDAADQRCRPRPRCAAGRRTWRSCGAHACLGSSLP